MPFPYLRAYRIPNELRRDPIGLLRYAFKEQAPVMTCGVVFVVAATYFIYQGLQYSAMGQEVKRYKLKYTVYRHDDPRVANIKE